MMFTRCLIGLSACLLLFVSPGCGPAEPRSRIEDALAVLQSDSSSARKKKACAEIRAALAEYPRDAADRAQLTERASRALVRALRDPISRLEAQDALASIGIPSFEPLFDAVLDADPGTQEGAVTCLVGMSLTAVPVLIPPLLGADEAARERAARILTRIGQPISPTLRMYYAKVLEPFAGPTTSHATAELSIHGKAGVLAFAQVFGDIGDETSILALMDGCETLRRSYPDLAAAHLRIIEGLGSAALESLSRAHQVNFDRLKLMVEMR